MNHRGQRALRDGDWKYLQVDGHDYLFNIAGDERERANLRRARTASAWRAMREAWERWNASDAADPGRRDGEPGLLGQGHAAALDAGSRDTCVPQGTAQSDRHTLAMPICPAGCPS